jgi:hypothetical protein
MDLKRRNATRLILVLVITMSAGFYFAGAPGICPCRDGPATGGLCAMEPSVGIKNFFLLQKHYQSWHDGYFGSRHYHEGKLRAFLLNLLGREVTTENDFTLVSPEGNDDRNVVCVFQTYRWLYVHGDLDVESLKNAVGKDYGVRGDWERNRILVSLAGKVKNFKLDWDAHGDTVHLYLEKIMVSSGNEKK